MSGCRKIDLSAMSSARRGSSDASTYIRPRGRPARAANDNRRVRASHFWRWTLLVAMAPAVGIAAAFSALF